MEKETSDVASKLAAAFAIAAVAGLIKYFQQFTLPPAQRPAWEWGVFLVKGVTAGGMGVLTSWLLSGWTGNGSYINFLIAIAGWGGAETGEFFWGLGKDALRKIAGGPTDDARKAP